MLRLILNPETGEVLATDGRQAWNIAGQVTDANLVHWKHFVEKQGVPNVQVWRNNPGYYGPHAIVVRVIPPRPFKPFTAGGNYLACKTAAEARHAVTEMLHCYIDRNTARANAEVQW